MRHLNVVQKLIVALLLINTVMAICRYHPWDQVRGNTCEGDDADKKCYAIAIDKWDNFEASVAAWAEQGDTILMAIAANQIIF